MSRYGWADQRGNGFCHECQPTDDRKLDAFTPADDDPCESCHRPIVSIPHPFNFSEGMQDGGNFVPWRIF